MINKKVILIKKGLTLVETFISITIISLLMLIIVQIMLIFSKLSKKATYLSDSDIKTKEIALKIERAIYNVKNLSDFNPQFLYTARNIPNPFDKNKVTDIIYTIYQSQTKPIAEIYIYPTLLNKKYYRKVIVYYYKKNFNDYKLNYLYLPEETFWKIEEILYKDNYNFYKGNYVIYNPSVNNINTNYKMLNINRRIYALQRFKVYFYFYAPDINNRPYSLYKNYPNFLRNEYKKKYFTKKSFFIIFDYLYY